MSIVSVDSVEEVERAEGGAKDTVEDGLESEARH